MAHALHDRQKGFRLTKANSPRRTPVPVPTVTVCRGCCCGSRKKHPDLDHDFQIQQLRSAVGDSGRVRVIDECLGACESSNVMVVLPSSAGRARGGRPTWLGPVVDDSTVRKIADWIGSGGPGVAAIPAELDRNLFTPPAPTPEPTRKDRPGKGPKTRR